MKKSICIGILIAGFAGVTAVGCKNSDPPEPKIETANDTNTAGHAPTAVTGAANGKPSKGGPGAASSE